MIGAIVTDWIQALASVAGVVIASVAVLVARMSLSQSHRSTRIAEQAAGLERQKILGSAIGLTDVAGFTPGSGSKGILVGMADYMRPSHQPLLLEAHLESASGEVLGGTTTPFCLVERGTDNLRPASSLVVPPEEEGAIGVVFELSPEQQHRLRPAGNNQGLGENAVMLPRGAVLRIVVQDPLGQEEHVFKIDERAFVFFRD
jgi:hypothetical protein